MRKRNLLYKYTELNAFTFKNLILSQLWFSPPDQMNDQLEGLIKIANVEFAPSKKAIDNFIEEKGDGYYKDIHGYSRAQQIISENGFLDFYMGHWFRGELSKYGISCFSKTPTEPLMWSHYADKHSGICLIYDQDILMESLKTVNYGFEMIPIRYGVKPSITLFEHKNRIEYKSDMPIICGKDSNWKYEKEIRIYKFENDETFSGGSYFIVNSALSGIIYGYHVSEEDKDAISLLIRNEPLYYNVAEYNEQIDFRTGKIFIDFA
jgi:hypothetical protein